MHDTHAIPAGDELKPATIHDHPSYGVIDDVFANSSNVVEFATDAVAVGSCGDIFDPGCVRLAASGSGLAETGLMVPGAASIHLDPAAARQLLSELAEVLGVTVLPDDDDAARNEAWDDDLTKADHARGAL